MLLLLFLLFSDELMAITFLSVMNNLFHSIIMRYMGPKRKGLDKYNFGVTFLFAIVLLSGKKGEIWKYILNILRVRHIG